MSVVRDFCGHGVGRLFHDEPNIVHIGGPGEGVVLQARHVLHRRADDQSRPSAREGAVRRLDRGDARPSLSAQFEHSVGVTETGVEMFTSRPASCTSRLTPQLSFARWRRKPRHDFGEGSAALSGHRERLRERFREAGADALADYEMLELVLFRAIPQRDIKPLAKDLLDRFGSFAEVIRCAASSG